MSIGHHVTHFIKATGYSFEGIRDTLRTETAFQQELFGLVVVPLFFFMVNGFADACVAAAAWLVVMAFELLNAAVEAVCNLVSPEYDPLVKKAKDAASAAVMLVIWANMCLWGYLLFA